IAFNVADTVLTAHGLSGMLGWNETAVAVTAALAAALLAIYGHDWLHRVFRWCFVLSLPLYTLLTLAIMWGKVPATHASAAGFSWVAFAAQFATSASYNITYAPAVSDYSRYLPLTTRPRAIISAVFVGAASSAIWLIALGAWLATRLGAADALMALHDAGNALHAGFGAVLAVVSVLALVATMGLNAYSGMLTIVTALNSLFGTAPSARLRVVAIGALTASWLALSLVLSVNSIALLFAVLTIMLYLLVPWTAVNLVDYFFVRRGRYAITHLFMPNGIYGAWGARGLIAYSVGFVAMLPFGVLPELYMGPAARALGGVDVGWLVGLLVSAGAYLLLVRDFDPAHEARAIAESEALLRGAR
ncbi:MAG TPA: cytosine permease, partial [Steroidobacteraceae bacterium]|nr:cytosine permease [Steroidobacteraceae bacterium]